MTREDPQMKIRLPAEIKDALASQAVANGRSLNAEIVGRLRSTLEEGFSDDSLLASIKELVVSKKLSDLFGTEVAEGVGLYATHVSGEGRYNEAVEELLRWALIDFGIMSPDEGETRPHSPFLRREPTEIDPEEQAAPDAALGDLSGGPRL